MKRLQQLIETYLDDRDALTPAEMEHLAAELDRSPALAETVKDQLLIRELISQKLAEDRRNFPAQVAQRRRDEARGEEALFRQVAEVRSLAAEELAERSRRRRGLRRYTFWIGVTAALLIAVAAGLFWERFVQSPPIATLTSLEGTVYVDRQGRRLAVANGYALKEGDRLTVGQEATAALRYPDRTAVLLDSESQIELHGGRHDAKRVALIAGGLSASVRPQPAETPMTIETAAAEIRVLGTEFFVYASEEGARVGVTQGRILLTRRRDGEGVEVTAGQSGFASADQLHVWEGVWPSNLAGAALVLESAPKAQTRDVSGVGRPVTLEQLGRARLTDHGALVLDDGAFVAAGAGEAILQACQPTGRMTVEAIVRPNDARQTQAAIVFAATGGDGTPNFALTQSKGRFGFLLKTSAGNHVFDLADTSDVYAQRLVVTYRPGRFACYLDGRLLFERNDVRGDFRTWSAGELMFGDQPQGGHNWRGILEGVAIYNRVLCKNEIARNAAAYAAILEERRPVSVSDAVVP